MNNLAFIVFCLIAVGLFGIALIPPFLVLRGKRFWAPWTMVGSAFFLLLVVGGTVAVQWYLDQKFQKIMASGAAYNSAAWQQHFEYVQLVMFVSFGLIVLFFLGYTVGFLGVASRWEAVARRADDLEAQTAILASRREQAEGEFAS